jgi:hypothetical protein
LPSPRIPLGKAHATGLFSRIVIQIARIGEQAKATQCKIARAALRRSVKELARKARVRNYCRGRLSATNYCTFGGNPGAMKSVATIGLDIAKNVFQEHGVDANGSRDS